MFSGKTHPAAQLKGKQASKAAIALKRAGKTHRSIDSLGLRLKIKKLIYFRHSSATLAYIFRANLIQALFR